MNFIDSNILTIVTFLPLAGAILLMFFPRRDRDVRYFALGISLITLLASLHLPWHFDRGNSGFQFEQNVPWISHPNIHYHLGIDGISLWLVVLTTFLMPLCVLISWKGIHDRVKEFFILHAGAGDRDDRRLHRARSVPLLLLLGSDADSDGADHRHLRPRPPHLRRGQVLPVHHDRLGLHAGRHPVALRRAPAASIS